MLIGETDILGQLEEAYDSQVKAHIAREPLKTVVERAIRFGKMVRTRTNISEGASGAREPSHNICKGEVRRSGETKRGRHRRRLRRQRAGQGAQGWRRRPYLRS
jgi:Glutamyl-tRNA reductase